MAKKPFPYNSLSPIHRCIVCGVQLKNNVVFRQRVNDADPPTLCHTHYIANEYAKGKRQSSYKARKAFLVVGKKK